MKKLLIVFICLVILGIGFLLWWNNGTQAANKADNTPKIFIIEKGEGIRSIANSLKKEGLIKDPIIFFLLVKQLGLDGKIQAGDFRLNPSMTAQEVAENLTHGTLDIWVTIPEGKRAEEVAEILKEKIPSYSPTWPTELMKHEGYLFPDTYLIPRDVTIEQIVDIMKNTFENKYASIGGTSKHGLTKDEIVIIASMVEREARFAGDRPLVASVIINRKNIGMKLDIDATVQYILGYQQDKKTWWKKDLTLDDLHINSPYNTYRTAGLPPTPIANPGLDVLRAVINPANTNYIYYISDSSGHNHYATTIEEHNANIKKYGL